MRGPRHFVALPYEHHTFATHGRGMMAVWLATCIVAAQGCALVSNSEETSSAAHLPAVDVSLPGSGAKGDTAPLWKPAGGKEGAIAKSATASTNSVPENPAQELKQLLGQLLAAGSIDRGTHDEMLKNVDRTDPATLKHLVWMYRAVVQGAPTPTPSTEQRLANVATSEPPAARPRSDREPAPNEKSIHPASAREGKSTIENAAASVETPDTPISPAEKPAPATTVRQSSATSPREVIPAEAHAEPVGDWRSELDRTIRAMEAAADQTPGDEQQRLHAYLRMLYLTAGRKNDALKPLPLANAAEQDFWSKELYGLATYLDHERLTDRGRRTAEATRHLSQAAMRLSESSPLSVRNLAFCSEVSSYGVYTSFAKHDFKPGQQVLLYAEVENFHSEETPKGFHTALKSHYQILDTRGQKVDEHDFAVAEERCQNPRRDYFVRYFVTLPQRIYDGRYTLQLTIEDTLGKKVGQSTIEFTVKSK